MPPELHNSATPRERFEERHGKVVTKYVSASLISHFRAENKYTVAYYPGGELLLDDTLQELAAEFGDAFVRCHRSTLVRCSLIEGCITTHPTCSLAVVGVPEGVRVSRRYRPAILAFLKSHKKSTSLSD